MTPRVLMALALGAVISASPAFALANSAAIDGQLLAEHAEGHRGAMHGGAPFQADGSIIAQLNLSADQKKRLQKVFADQRTQSAAKQHDLTAKRHKLMDMFRNGNGNRNDALELNRQIGSLHQELMAQRINSMFDIKAILTPEQFKKYRQLMMSRMKHWQGNRAAKQKANLNDAFHGVM